MQIGHPITERRFTICYPSFEGCRLYSRHYRFGRRWHLLRSGRNGRRHWRGINLDAVPLKDKSLTAWEILLSESQERMLIALPPEKLTEAAGHA